jgi:hypothetical protein
MQRVQEFSNLLAFIIFAMQRNSKLPETTESDAHCIKEKYYHLLE